MGSVLLSERVRRTRRSVPTINEIIHAKARITEHTALELEHALNIPAHVWMALEMNYRIALARGQNRLQRPGQMNATISPTTRRPGSLQGLVPRLYRALDLFCCAGGAGMGLHRAGYNVTGVDIVNQPNYPFAFVQGDALEADLSGYDFVWASPPCQNHSRMSGCREGLRDKYPSLIAATRAKLKAWGGPWIIENVVGAPLENPVMLCGAMFGLATYRHRIFESNVPLTVPPHPKHETPTSKAGHWKPGTLISVAGNCAPMTMAREAMGIDWTNRAELVEAIPPAFSEHLARQTLRVLKAGHDEMRDAKGEKRQ